MARIGRNQPCPCGSGRKYKRCCEPGDRANEVRPGSAAGDKRPRFDGTYFRFRLRLRVEQPSVWRAFLLRGDASFADLHSAIQACGWQDCHLWRFADASGEGLAGVPGDDPMGPVDGMFAGLFGRGKPDPDAEGVPLATHFRCAGDACVYTYDFGDNWEHDVELEALERHGGQFDRALIGGEGVFPPEDCGGIPGWARLFEYYETGKDPWDDVESLKLWLERRPFEPFDLARAKRVFGAVVDVGASEPDAPPVRVPKMTQPLANELAAHAQGALAEFVQKVGLDVRVRRGTWTDANAKFEIEVSTVREDGVVMNKDAEVFLDNCEDFGLRESDLGREFTCGDEVLRVIGLRPRSKHAVLCEPIRPRRERLMKMSASVVRNHLDRSGTPASGAASSLRLLEDRGDGTGA